MKRIFTIIAAVFLTASTWAQSPEKMSYQAVVRDAANDLVTESQVGMQISILQGAADGAAVYVETQTPTTNANGLVSIEIGGGTVVSGDFSTIDWSAGPYFIKTETDPTGGTNYTIEGTSQLLGVPYAMFAKIADSIAGGIVEADPIYSAWNKSYIDLTNKPVIVDTITAVLDTITQFVRSEIDGDPTNEIQGLSDVLSINNDANNNAIVNISQQGIGTSNPSSCAILEVNSKTQGFLPPRMTNIDIYSILNPLEGLTVYSTDEHKPFYFNGTQWVSYDTNTQLPPPPTLSIGDFYAGGVIFYLDATKYHGLVCSVTDLSTDATWGCFGIAIDGADSQLLGDGAQNTIDILNGCSESGTAADICNLAVINGYDDWFLPSLNELKEMKINKDIINTTAIANSGTAFVNNVNYWSSSETNDNSAWLIVFNAGYGTGYKSNHQYVRAVRAF